MGVGHVKTSSKHFAGVKAESPTFDRRQRHRIATRERIFRAALQLFAERGYLQTTVEQITEAADVGKGTFFNYFPTKEHVLSRYGEERIEAVERALDKVKNGGCSVLAALKDLATSLAGQAGERPELLRAVYAANLTSAPVLAELCERVDRARNLLTQIFLLGQKRGEIRRDLLAHEMARLIRLIFMGVTFAWSVKPEGSLPETGAQVWELLYPSFVASAANGPRGRKR